MVNATEFVLGLYLGILIGFIIGMFLDYWIQIHHTIKERISDWCDERSNLRYHFCDYCGKFLVKKALHCKKCKKKSDNWTKHDWESYFASDYDPLEWEERNGGI